MQNIKRNWNLYNLRLVDRGRPSNYLLPSVENRGNDLKVLNKDKVGRPYQYSGVEIFAAFAIKCIFKLIAYLLDKVRRNAKPKYLNIKIKPNIY